jgi:saccharopine dehydrogenase-like NADP-dependent oxidoreductase
LRIVILGGAGNFGQRIARALASRVDMELISASRSGNAIAGAPQVRPATLDIAASDFAARLTALRPDAVIHCVGPFQGQDYCVVRASLAAGAHYLDLADGRAFVAGFTAANDALAHAADRLAVTGVSTLPALSSAVLDQLASRFESLESVEISIAPGQRAVRGTATIEAVFSYLGRPFQWLQEGQWRTAHGWQELKRLQFAFGRRWAAACDVPDLELLPTRFSSVRTVQFRAALELGIEHFGLWFLAALRRIGLPLQIARWARTLDRMASILEPFGGPYGGMLISVVGRMASGSRRRLTWHITAPAVEGPEIPCMPAILLARRLAQGCLAQRGAYPCMGFLTLCEFEPEFARWGMRTQVEEGAA